MSVAEVMKKKLNEELSPEKLVLEDESFMHSGHVGANPEGESHFNLLIVSDKFEGVSRVQRQRMVYEILADELKERVHALSLQTLTLKEYKSA